MPLHGKIVVIKRSGGDGTEFPLTASCLFGRKPDCDIRIQLPQVSKDHCRIDLNENKEVMLTNLSSVNPTRINGEVMKQAQRLTHGDVITIIDRSFRFEYPPEPTPKKKRLSLAGKSETLQVLHDQQVADPGALVTGERRKSSELISDSHCLKDGTNTSNVQALAIEDCEETAKEADLTGPQQRKPNDKESRSPFSELYQMIKQNLNMKSPCKPAEVAQSKTLLSRCEPQKTAEVNTAEVNTAAEVTGGDEPTSQEGRSAPLPKKMTEQKRRSSVGCVEQTDGEQTERTSGGEATPKSAKRRSEVSPVEVSPVPSLAVSIVSALPAEGRVEDSFQSVATPSKATPKKNRRSLETPAKWPVPEEKGTPAPQTKPQRGTPKKFSASEVAGQIVSENSVTEETVQSAENSETPKGRRSKASTVVPCEISAGTPDAPIGSLSSDGDEVLELKQAQCESEAEMSEAVQNEKSPKAKEAASPRRVSPRKSPGKKLPASDVLLEVELIAPPSGGKSVNAGTPKSSGKKRKSEKLGSDLPGPQLKRKRVSFGGQLSPELFDRSLPPNSPLRKGATPGRRSLSVLRQSVLRGSFATSLIEELRAEVSSPKSKTPRCSPGKKASPKPATPITVADEGTGTMELSACVTPRVPLRRKSMKSTSKRTPKSTRKSVLEVIRSRRSGASRANLKVVSSWADIVKFGVTKPQTGTTTKKCIRKPTTVKKTVVKKLKTPAKKIKEHFSTGHAASPATIVVGKAHTKVAQTTGCAPKIVHNIALLRKNMKINEDLSGIAEIFCTPVNVQKTNQTSGSVCPETPQAAATSFTESSVMDTPEEMGEMVVSPLSVIGTEKCGVYDSEAIAWLLQEDQDSSLNGDDAPEELMEEPSDYLPSEVCETSEEKISEDYASPEFEKSVPGLGDAGMASKEESIEQMHEENHNATKKSVRGRRPKQIENISGVDAKIGDPANPQSDAEINSAGDAHQNLPEVKPKRAPIRTIGRGKKSKLTDETNEGNKVECIEKVEDGPETVPTPRRGRKPKQVESEGHITVAQTTESIVCDTERSDVAHGFESKEEVPIIKSGRGRKAKAAMTEDLTSLEVLPKRTRHGAVNKVAMQTVASPVPSLKSGRGRKAQNLESTEEMIPVQADVSSADSSTKPPKKVRGTRRQAKISDTVDLDVISPASLDGDCIPDTSLSKDLVKNGREEVSTRRKAVSRKAGVSEPDKLEIETSIKNVKRAPAKKYVNWSSDLVMSRNTEIGVLPSTEEGSQQRPLAISEKSTAGFAENADNGDETKANLEQQSNPRRGRAGKKSTVQPTESAPVTEPCGPEPYTGKAQSTRKGRTQAVKPKSDPVKDDVPIAKRGPKRKLTQKGTDEVTGDESVSLDSLPKRARGRMTKVEETKIEDNQTNETKRGSTKKSGKTLDNEVEETEPIVETPKPARRGRRKLVQQDEVEPVPVQEECPTKSKMESAKQTATRGRAKTEKKAEAKPVRRTRQK
ncbi:hypothetical protein SKAU_G00143380 [Synaphobranchus kaupii]|uniref:FHA domain-containing protein n=1 Tax=Synaphobranchus kaupii TaxID=118154 RepID=A0A9Q1J2D0_SYNKA|nr:hypothetical protein SKAU_G00143380 [Synaphobranchus kaupii]